jgi:anaerobic magnesium-protoporphyrin IX monomethyl ester cyclase
MSGNLLFIHVNEWGELRSPDTIPISQAYQLASLRAHGFSGRILGDYLDRPLAPAMVREAILRDRPLALGFTVYEANINRVRVWARYARELAPELPIILGGPQITFMPGEGLLQMPEADALCRGEGETVILELARNLSRGRGLDSVPGLCHRQGEGVAETEPLPGFQDLDSIPSPFLSDIIDPAGKDRVILFTSRGCPASCTFCYTPRASGRRVRYHSNERIVAELQHLYGRGARDFWFADPNFAAARGRLVSLLEEIIARVPGISFWCQSRYDHMDRDLARLLKAAGAHTVAFGLEAGDPEVLQAIDKRLDLEKMAAAIRLVQEAGIEVELFTMFGLPGETLSRACKTLDFVKASGVAVEGNSISQQLHLFFGTPISEAPAAHGVRPSSLTRPAYLSVGRDFETAAMSREEIRRMSLLWRLHRSDFGADVEAGRNLFERAAFITGNEGDFAGRPEADLLLARILLNLEEYDQAAPLIARLAAAYEDVSMVRRFLAGPFTGFKAARRAAAGPGCRVIFDCRGLAEGRVVPATESWYQEAVIGDNTLLPDFERGLLGMRGGRPGQFAVRFPADYGQEELAGRTLTFQVLVHQVLEPVRVASAREIPGLPRNKYRLFDLAGLRKHNERLYYLVLRDLVFRDLHQEMTDFLSLLKFKLQLGCRQEARAMWAILAPGSEAARYAGRILLTAGQAEEAIGLLATRAQDGEGVIDLIKAYIRTENYQEAERLAADPLLAADIRALDLRVGLASHLRLPVADYLARMDDLLRHQVEALMEHSAVSFPHAKAQSR